MLIWLLSLIESESDTGSLCRAAAALATKHFPSCAAEDEQGLTDASPEFMQHLLQRAQRKASPIFVCTRCECTGALEAQSWLHAALMPRSMASSQVAQPGRLIAVGRGNMVLKVSYQNMFTIMSNLDVT